MKCKWNQCKNEARAKSPFCSGTCKKRYARSETDVPVEVGQEQVGQPSGTSKSDNEVGHGKYNSDITICGTDEAPNPDRSVEVDFDEPNRPPCTPDQLTSSCLTCVEQCDYLHCQTTAVPGEAEYVGEV